MRRDERDETYRRFRAAVNMSARQLERWLATQESRSVGQRRDGGESIGHRAGRRTVSLLRARKEDLTEADCAHMRKVAAFVARKTAQHPAGDVARSRWRYSLMNWGHDPLGH